MNTSYTKNGPPPPSLAPLSPLRTLKWKSARNSSPNKDETAVHGYGPIFMGSCRVWEVSQSHLFCVVSALQLNL